MTSDGGVLLKKTMEKEALVQIQKLIVSSIASGSFLQRITSFVDSVMYVHYREPTFIIADGNTISGIIIGYAPGMRAFIAGSNTHLESLEISQCALDRVPQTLPKITKLNSLSIRQCKITALRLDLLTDNQNLKILDLSHNQIRQLLPVTGRPARMLSIEKLMLSGNPLSHFDMTVLASMSRLASLYLQETQTIHFEVSTRITFQNFHTFYFEKNQVTLINLRNLTIPNFESLVLGSNIINKLPPMPERLPKLNYFALHRTMLTQLDLSYFRPYQNLTMIYITKNQINSVSASSPVQLPVVRLSLNGNKITTFDISRCDMPNIYLLDLTDNRLTVIPPVYDKYPKIQLTMNGNPVLPCNALLPYKDQLEKSLFKKDQIDVSMACSTTSLLFVGKSTKICCEG
uniref:Uncharacterized protein n=1 Tax=Anopheles coluzzii TaxID=1518534 RepID=A0A6E8VTX1_ANOCL